MSLKPNKNSYIEKQKVKFILSMLKEEKELKEVESIFIRGNLGSKMGLIRKRAKISFCELEFKNQ